MRFLFVLALALACAANAGAGVVNENDARDYARSFLTNAMASSSSAAERAKATAVKLDLADVRCDEDGTPLLYTFNAADDGGFVIMSVGKGTPSVLGFSTEGSIDAGNMPPALAEMLDAYALNLAAQNNNDDDEWYDTPYSGRGKAKLTPVEYVTKPLTKTKWDQGNPYNYYTPLWAKKPYNKRVLSNMVTGCVATGLAQYIYWYHTNMHLSFDVPDSIAAYTVTFKDGDKEALAVVKDSVDVINSRAYLYKVNLKKERIELSALPSTTFAWDKMREKYNSHYISTAADTCAALALLMRYCGQAVKMQYSPNGSSASTATTARALNNYFDVGDHTAFYYSSENRTEAEFVSIAAREIGAKKRPVLFGGSDVGGHCFIFDGLAYLAENKKGICFHVNWGWSGGHNGWFRAVLLNPNGRNFSFNRDYVVLVPNSEKADYANSTKLTVNLKETSLVDKNLAYKYATDSAMTNTLRLTSYNDSKTGAFGYYISPVVTTINDTKNASSTGKLIGTPAKYHLKSDYNVTDTLHKSQGTANVKVPFADVVAYMDSMHIDTCYLTYAHRHADNSFDVIAGEEMGYYFMRTATSDSVLVRPNLWNSGDLTLDSISTQGQDTVILHSLKLHNIIPVPIGGAYGFTVNYGLWDSEKERFKGETTAKYSYYINGKTNLRIFVNSKEPSWTAAPEDTIKFVVKAKNGQVIYERLLTVKDILEKESGIEDITIEPAEALPQDDAIYDLQGRRLNAVPEQGVYIRGGKKYILR